MLEEELLVGDKVVSLWAYEGLSWHAFCTVFRGRSRVTVPYVYLSRDSTSVMPDFDVR
jgi:hypothetical protein